MNVLTLDELKAMKPKSIFKMGQFQYEQATWKFVAARGGHYDWAIYSGPTTWSAIGIYLYGDKIHDKELIKQLVPCTGEALDMYRW